MSAIVTIIVVIFAAAASAVEVTSTVDNGGGRATNSIAAYCHDGCIGGIGGVSSANGTTTRHGYIGLLTEVTELSVTGTPVAVNENATTQLSGTAAMDDNTVTALTGSEINWIAPAWPLANITANGVASAAVVYATTYAAINGSYLGVAGNGSLLVLDTIPDNYGTYAGDGIPDSWQAQYFGLDNPNAAPNKDASGTGQNNLFKYTAGLDPTNAASVFRLHIVPVAGQANRKNLIFKPRWNDRVYTPMFRTNLLTGAWQTLTNTNIADDGTERTITDLAATESNKFYRIQIHYP